MQTAVSTRTLNSYLYKMDHVLYEIKDQKGILRDNDYDMWKKEVIEDLAASGYIKESGEKYVITPQGRDVIKHDSFLNYNKKSNTQDEVEMVHTESLQIFRNPYFVAMLSFIAMTVITLFKLK
ncbi:hypothetical protein BH23BAC2_BH23BAC2_03110 [soil metagenome]